MEGQLSGLTAAGGARSGGAGGLPSGVKIQQPQQFSGSEAEGALEAWLYSVELYFELTGMRVARQQVPVALMLLAGDAAVWWRTVKADHPLD